MRWLHDDSLFYSLFFVIVAVISFGLGRLSVLEGELWGVMKEQPAAVRVSAPPPAVATEARSSPDPLEARPATADTNASADIYYVASVNGSKYHFPWCGSASQIKDTNRLTFPTKEAAEARGYTPAANCPGL